MDVQLTQPAQPSPGSPPDVSFYVLAKELAITLGITSGRVRQLISRDQLPSRLATKDEIYQLYKQGRITGITTTGVRLIHIDDVNSFIANPDKRSTIYKRQKASRSVEPKGDHTEITHG